jgi:hypothetical protein
MSLILEALKKSEAERQRQSGPTLLEVRIAKPQRRYPIWALVVGALLAVNMILLLVFVLRRPSARRSGHPPAHRSRQRQRPPTSSAARQPHRRCHRARLRPSRRAVPMPMSVLPPTTRPHCPMTRGGAAQNPADDQPAVARTLRWHEDSAR